VCRPLTATSGDRLAAWFVVLLMAVGSAVLWIGIPVGSLWLVSKLTESSATHFVAAVVGIPVAMVLFAPVLFWLNRLYLRIVLGGRLSVDLDEDAEQPRFMRGPLEPILVSSLLVALITLLVWIFVIAKTPPWTVW
jgi:hypothetical protein